MDALLKIIVIAKENTSLKLNETLKNLINQTYSPTSIVVADINSSYSGYSIGLQEDLEQYPGISYIKLKESLSRMEVYNYFIEKIEHGYISFLNSSDLWESRTGTLAIKQFKEHEKVGAVFFDGTLTKEKGIYADPEHFFKNQSFLWRILNLEVKTSMQVVYDVKALKSIGGFKKDYSVFYDTDTLLRLNKDYQIIALPIKLCASFLIYKENYEYALMDYKKIHLNHIDVFLKNKKVNEFYYANIVKLASKSYLWLNYMLYILLFLMKYPLISIKNILKLVNKYRRKNCATARKYVLIFQSITKLYYQRNKILRNKSVIISKNKEHGLLRKLIVPSSDKKIAKGQYFSNKDIETVEIHSSVLEIKNHAFSNCNNLKEVIIPDDSQLKRIGAYAFSNCVSLEKMDLKRNLHAIEPYSFMGCSKLKSVEFPEESRVVEIKKGAFLGCVNLENMLLNGNIKKIGHYSFAGCYKLKTFVFPKIDDLDYLGRKAFIYCENLSYFHLSKSMRTIRKKTFYGCKSIRKISIPESVTNIEKKAFRKCDSLMSVTLLNKDIVISSNVFDKHTEVEKIDL